MTQERDIQERIATIKELQEHQRQGAESDSQHAANQDDLLAALDTERVSDRVMSAEQFASLEAFCRSRSERPIGPMGAIAPAAGARSIRRPGRTPKGAPAPLKKRPVRVEPVKEEVVAEPPEQAADEPTLVMRERLEPRKRRDESTQVIRTRKIPRDAVDEDGSVLPTDHIETLPGHGQVDPYSQTSPGFSADSLSETQPIARAKAPTQEPVEPTDDVATAPGMAGLNANPTERTQVVRRRRIHPDSVDPDTGNVLPTDHVATAPGMAGLDSDPSGVTQVLRRGA